MPLLQKSEKKKIYFSTTFTLFYYHLRQAFLVFCQRPKSEFNENIRKSKSAGGIWAQLVNEFLHYVEKNMY